MSTPLNYQTLVEINTNPSGTANYEALAAGITTNSASLNETIDTKAFLDGNGGQESSITGKQLVQSLSGERRIGDAAQDYIFGKIFDLGSDLETDMKITNSNGDVVEADIVISITTPPGGDANAVEAIGIDLRASGMPTLTEATSATALTATVAGGTASGTTSFTATPGSGNTLAYTLTDAAVTQNDRQYVQPASVIAYTSGDDIAATAGQFLNMWELDAYNHLVAFLSDELESGDITA